MSSLKTAFRAWSGSDGIANVEGTGRQDVDWIQLAQDIVIVIIQVCASVLVKCFVRVF
jgi:hypothetical protein